MKKLVFFLFIFTFFGAFSQKNQDRQQLKIMFLPTDTITPSAFVNVMEKGESVSLDARFAKLAGDKVVIDFNKSPNLSLIKSFGEFSSEVSVFGSIVLRKNFNCEAVFNRKKNQLEFPKDSIWQYITTQFVSVTIVPKISEDSLRKMTLNQVCKILGVSTVDTVREKKIISKLYFAGVVIFDPASTPREIRAGISKSEEESACWYFGTKSQKERLKRNLIANRSLIVGGTVPKKNIKKWKVVK